LKSVKGLRFNLGRNRPLANAMLLETKPRPHALYIVPPSAGADFEEALKKMIEARPDLGAWVWRVVEGDMPPIPT
jgi:hypothetical protein